MVLLSAHFVFIDFSDLADEAYSQFSQLIGRARLAKRGLELDLIYLSAAQHLRTLHARLELVNALYGLGLLLSNALVGQMINVV